MRRNLHHRRCSGLLALLVALIVALGLPAQSGVHVWDLNPQVQVNEQDAPHAPTSAECHAGAWSALQLSIALSMLFAVNSLLAALPPATISAPDSYESALDTPPPRV
jgi:hypothetical protein